MNKKNILIVNSVFPPFTGGSGFFIQQLAEELIKKNFKVFVFTGGDINKKENINGVKLFRVNSFPMTNPFLKTDYMNKYLEKKFEKLVNNNEINILHFNSLQGLGSNLVEFSLKKHFRTILTIHDFWWICPFLFLHDENFCKKPIKNHYLYCSDNISMAQKIERWYYHKRILENKNLIIVTPTKNIKEALIYSGIIKKNKEVFVIPNGIPNFFKKNTNNIYQKNHTDKTLFAYLGLNHQSKGFKLLLKANKIIEKISDKYNIVLFGIKKNDIPKSLRSKKIIFKNKILREKLNSSLRQIDCIIIPSIVPESYSFLARESLILNKIILSSNLGALSEIKSPNHITFTPFDPVKLVEKMLLVMSIKNHKNNKKFNEVSTEKVTKEYIKLYL